MKIIVFILIAAVGVWAYFNVDFNQLKNNTVQGVSNGVKNEKTIFGVNNSREQSRKQTQDVLNGF